VNKQNEEEKKTEKKKEINMDQHTAPNFLTTQEKKKRENKVATNRIEII
jgi:hypothetical protein